MEAQLRERQVPLFGLEHRRPADTFDLLGFTLQSELTYTNLLTVLDLSGIPLHQEDRRAGHPLVCIGGPCASNPEPLAHFVDFALIGDAEDALGEVLELVGTWKKRHGEMASWGPALRSGLLAELAIGVGGVYVPSLYEVRKGSRSLPRRRRSQM